MRKKLKWTRFSDFTGENLVDNNNCFALLNQQVYPGWNFFDNNVIKLVQYILKEDSNSLLPMTRYAEDPGNIMAIFSDKEFCKGKAMTWPCCEYLKISISISFSLSASSIIRMFWHGLTEQVLKKGLSYHFNKQ